MVPPTLARFVVVDKLRIFFSFFLVLGLWAGAVPMFGTPDEPAHMVRAAGIVRGQVNGERGEDNRVRFLVPAILASHPGCYAFKPEQTADCLDIPDDTGETLVATTASEYPPFFHLVTGLPTLVSSGLRSLYFMRLANAAVCAALLTMALGNIKLMPRRGPVAVAMAVALTPMVLFLSGPVNPSGIAATSGVAIWTAALVLGEKTSTRSMAWSAAAFGVPVCILLMTRRDAILWGGAIAITLAITIPWKRIVEIAGQRIVWVWSSVIVATAAAQYFLWTGENASGFSEASPGGAGDEAFGRGFRYLWEAVGIMGWIDTSMPSVVYHGWWLLLAGLVLGVLVVAAPRDVVAILVSIVLLLGLTTLIGSVRYPYFQGRYYLPFAVGIPIIAGNSIARAGHYMISKRGTRVVLGWIFILHQLSFAQQIRRYAVGVSGTWNFAFDHQWSPTPGPIWLFLVSYFIATGSMMMLFARVALADQLIPVTSTERTTAD